MSMPRPYQSGTYTQTRTFAWSGTNLISSTNPETATVTYEYSGNRVTKKTDAKGRETHYVYDGYGRLTQVQKWTWQARYDYYNGWVSYLGEAPEQRVDYYYDTNPFV